MATSTTVVTNPLISIGTYKQNAALKARLTGTLNNYTVLALGNCDEASVPSYGRYAFSASELTLELTLSDSLISQYSNLGTYGTWKKVQIYQIKVYFGSTLLKVIRCYQKTTTGYGTSDIENIDMRTGNGVVQYALSIPLDSTKNHTHTGNYSSTVSHGYTEPTTNNNLTLYESGNHRLYVEIEYSDEYKSTGMSTVVWTHKTVTFELGYVYVYPMTLNGITIYHSSAQKKFYKNGTFNHNNVTVYSRWYYHSLFGGNLGGFYNVTESASFSTPNLTSAGTKTVSVSYSGFSQSYNIEVVGVSSVGEDSRVNFKYLNDSYLPDTPTQVAVTYTDGTTTTITPSSSNFAWTSGDFNSVGNRTWSYKIYDTNTQEWVEGSSMKKVIDVQSLSVKTNPTTTTYQTNETFSKTGLVLTADYGDAGTKDISANSSPISLDDVTLSVPDMTTVGIKTITATYRGQHATFDITVDGLKSIRLVKPTLKFLKGTASPNLTNGLQIFYTCSDQAETELQLSDNKVTIDTSSVNLGVEGTYTVTVTVTHEGNSISDTYDVVVYALESIAVSNYKNEFIYSNSAPTFSTGALTVTGHFSDGSERDLSSSEYTVSAPDNMEVGTHTVTVSSTIGATKSTTYEIRVVEDYPTAVTSVDITNWNDTFVEGQAFSKTGIVVKATMMSGITNKEVDFSTSLDGDIFGTDITDGSTNFNIYVQTNDSENPLEVAYDSSIVKKSGQSSSLTAKYDVLDSISVTSEISGMFTEASSLRAYRAGDNFKTEGLKVTANYRFSGAKTVTGYTLTYGNNVIDSQYVWKVADRGQQTITVSFGGKTTTYTVKIATLLSITATAADKTQYNRHETLDLTQTTVTVTAYYTYDGETAIAGSLTLSSDAYTIVNQSRKLLPDNQDGLTTTFVVNYTEAGITKTDSFDITVKALSSVSLSTNKFSVNYGESFTLVGKSLDVVFNTGDQYSLVINSGNTVTISGTTYNLALSLDSLIIRNKAENVTVGLSFGGETKYATFTIHCIYLSAITLDASYYNGTLYAGESIALEHLSVTKTIASTDTDDANYPVTSSVDNADVSFSISDGQILMVGNNVIGATYSMGIGDTLQSKSASVTLYAYQVALQSININSTDAEDITDMLSYVEGQSLSLVDLVVSAIFNRTASNRDLALTECKIYFDDEKKYYTSSVSLDDNGKDLIVAYTYDGVTKTVTVGQLTVIAKVLTGISVRAASTHKTNYLIGDKFSTAGLIIEATYNDGYEEVLSSGYTTDYDSYKSNAFTDDDLGNSKTVTISLTVAGTTQTCTYSINVTAPALSSLRFDTSLVNLSVTNGTVYSLSGLVVYGVFENGYEEQVTYTTPNITTELALNANNEVSFASNNLGVKNVTIQALNPYDNAQLAVTGQLPITVTPNLELIDIRLKFNEEYDPYNYRVGDTYDAKGLTVEALFKDTDWMAVSGFETANPTLGSLLRSGGRLTVEVSYTSQGVVKSQTYVIVVAMPYDSGLVEENSYKVAFNVASITHDEATIEFSEDTQLPLFHSNLISVDNNVENSTYGMNVYTGNDANADCIGYMKLGSTSEIDGSVIENAKVILFDDPVNPIDGDGNIIVKFPHYVSGYADRVNKCHFGIIYNKRLFVSGNPDYPNYDWHSSEVNSSQVENYDTEEERDLTYFSDLDFQKYGSENSAVKGYDIYRDGTLLVFKEKSQHEATIYYRERKIVNASSYDGEVVSEGELAEEAYSCFEVNPNGGSGAISPYTIINFVGETLVLTRDGIKAITSKETTLNNAKYTYDVSSHINNKLLKNNDLNYVFISQYKEKLLVRTDEGLYIGEYKLRDENSEYEWYFCDNINAYYFFEIDDELYFSDKQGNISRFMDDDSIIVKDKPRTYIGLGGTTLSIDANNDVIIVSKNYADKVVEGNQFHLLSKISAITGNVTDESQVYAKMGSFVEKNYRENQLRDSLSTFDQTAWEGVIDSDRNQIVIKPYTSEGEIDYERMFDTLLLFPTYKEVYLDSIVGQVVNVSVDTPYVLKRIKSNESFDYRFILLNEVNEEIDLTGITSFRMSFRVNGVAVAYITDVENYGTDGGKQFKVGLPLKNEGYLKLDLIYYNNRNGTYQGVITEHVNVHSYFISKAFDLGSSEYGKTIHKWTLINDSSIASAMNVGYIASRSYADFKVSVKQLGGARQLNFEGLNFEKLHFTNDKLPHIYDKFRVLPRVGFIRFIFSNDEGTRMVLSKLEIIYSYTLLMKGVK